MVVFSLTLIRHGETLANRENIIQGQTDVPLSNLGLQQARLVASRLEQEKFTHIFASDLKRAIQTAQTIIEANKVSRCPLVQDKRLRERKFGEFEGKNFRDLAAAAQRHSVKVANFTPNGAETIDQVLERAQSFFYYLCQHLLEATLADNCTPTPSKRRLTSSSSSCTTLDIQLGDSPVNITFGLSDADSFPARDQPLFSDGITSSTNHLPYNLSDFSVFSVEDDEDGNETVIARSGSSSSSGCSSLPESSESGDLDISASIEDYSPTSPNLNLISQTGDQAFAPFPLGIDLANTASVGVVSLQKNHFPGRSLWADTAPVSIPLDLTPRLMGGSAGVSQRDQVFCGAVTDAEIRSTVPGPQNVVCGCPNVSLSPLLEHRLSSLSSISSGRSSSIDEADVGPSVTADVLIVSHSGFLKELIRYFVDHLHCKIPGGKRVGLYCPNASISRFMVTFEEEMDKPIVTCLFIYDKDHLAQMQVDEAVGVL